MNAPRLNLNTIRVVLALALAFFDARALLADGSYREIDAYVEQQLKALNVAGASLAILEGDQITHMKGFGVSSPAGKTPTPQTLFYICSLTKSFTALAVMQLVESGKIELDERVQHYLPWFALADSRAAAQLTVRHLLNQTSGLPIKTEWQTLVDFDSSPNATEKQVRQLATFKPSRPVGSKFEYTNTNYNLLGLIVEAASGEKYADYVQSHIFDPLDMNHSYTSKAMARNDDLSSGYISWFGVPSPVPNLPAPTGSLPSGQIISCAEDMAQFLIAQLNGGSYRGIQILSAEGIAAMHRPAADATTVGIPLGYGMGWFSEKTSEGARIWHDGTAPDYFAYMALLPEQNKGMILLINTNELILNFAAFSFLGGDIASLLAGAQPPTRSWAMIPWILRAFLLIPLLQILGVLVIVRAVRRWRQDAGRRPGAILKWVYILLLPIPNLALLFGALYLVASGVLRFWLLYMADLSWLILVCGGFALVWIIVRTRILLGAFRTSRA